MHGYFAESVSVISKGSWWRVYVLRSVCLAHLTSMVKHLPNDIKFHLPGEFLLG